MPPDIISLYTSLGLDPKPHAPNELCGPCPGCGGRDRFILFVGKGKDGLGKFWCRQCRKNGDSIQFLYDFKGLDYRAACKELGREPITGQPRTPRAASAPAQAAPAAPSWTPRESIAPAGVWQKKAAALVEWAAHELEKTPQTLAWLESERGILPATARRFRLGWNPADIYRDRKAWGLPAEIKETGKPRRLWIPAGLLVPVLDPAGLVYRVKIRRSTPGPKEPRYLPLPSPERCTAPLIIEGQASAWVIVEAELDAILLAQDAGHLANVAALGSASYRPDAALFAKLTAAPFTLLSLDEDEAGGKAAVTWWSDHLLPGRFRVWPVPEGKDPCEALITYNWDLAAWIEAALPPACLPKKAAPAAAAERKPEPSAAITESAPGPGHAPAMQPEHAAPDLAAVAAAAVPLSMAAASVSPAAPAAPVPAAVAAPSITAPAVLDLQTPSAPAAPLTTPALATAPEPPLTGAITPPATIAPSRPASRPRPWPGPDLPGQTPILIAAAVDGVKSFFPGAFREIRGSVVALPNLDRAPETPAEAAYQDLTASLSRRPDDWWLVLGRGDLLMLATRPELLEAAGYLRAMAELAFPLIEPRLLAAGYLHHEPTEACYAPAIPSER